MRRRFAVIVILGSVLTGMLPAAAGAANAPLPASMAAVGDSITQAASTGGSLGADYPANSWATGTNTTVDSHYLRLIRAGAPISGRNHNLSVSGAKVGGLNAQMQSAVALRPDYLTVLIGGNDVCTDTAAGMTSTSAFESSFVTAMETITRGSPTTRIYVAGIPDVFQLWNLFKGNWWARLVWSAGGICQSLLANPTSMQQVDVQRRADVRARNQAFNAILASVCERYVQCHHDGGRVFAYQFATSDVSADYFHPSTSGQKNLARETWAAGYTWVTNAPPTASFTFTCTGLTCAFTDASTDTDGTIASRSWSFGDGATSVETNPSRTYAAGGTYTVTLTVTDSGGATASTTRSVTVSAPVINVPPTAAFSYSCAGLTCAFTDGSTDADGSIASRSWSFGDGSTSTATNPSRTYSVAGTYTVGLTVTDNGGASASTSQQVTVSAPAAQSMWVSGLSETASSTKSGWAATITVTVSGEAGTVAGVTVSGTWTGAAGPTGCTTGTNGQCSFTSSNVNKKVASATYSVTGLTKAGWGYVPTQNAATSVTVNRP